MTLIALAPLPVFLIGIFIFGKFVRPIYENPVEAGRDQHQAEENLSGIQVIKGLRAGGA